MKLPAFRPFAALRLACDGRDPGAGCPAARRLRVVARVAAGALLIPPALWALVVTLVPTDCARQRIADRLSTASGRQVKLGKLSVGYDGRVHLADLEIGAPASGHDPWLRVGQASINVNLVQLLLGHVDPTELDVSGLRLRVLRRRDGSLELGDFLSTPRDATEARGVEADGGPTGLTVRVLDGTIEVRDEPTASRLEFVQLEGRATCKGHLLSVHELRGRLNGGTFALAMQLDREGQTPAFEGHFKAEHVALGEGTHALAYVVPVLAGADATGKLDGRLALDLYAQGKGDTREQIRRTLVGSGHVVLDPVQLDGSSLLDEIGHVVDLPAENRVGSVTADLVLKDGRVATDNLTIDVARIPITLSGWTNFDGRINYKLRTDDLVERLPSRARNLLSELSVDLNTVADVRVNGTLETLAVTVDGLALNPGRPGDPPSKTGGDDRERLREIGRRLRDRVRR